VRKLSAAVAACLFLLLGGCAVLPDYIGPELEHLSHATQHEPFTSHPTNYGSEVFNITAEWGALDGGPYAELSEGIDLDPCRGGACGEIAGPREQFHARFGWRFRIR